MTYRRSPVPWFELENSAYVDAIVRIYTVDEGTGLRTNTLATIYDSIVGLGTIPNPVQLDSNGAQPLPMYHDVPIEAVIVGQTGTDTTGIWYPSLSASDVTAAINAAAAAQASALLAKQWATQLTLPIEPGLYSAKQYSLNAMQSASDAGGFAGAAAASAAAAAASALSANPLVIPSLIGPRTTLWYDMVNASFLDSSLTLTHVGTASAFDRFGQSILYPANTPRFEWSVPSLAPLGLQINTDIVTRSVDGTIVNPSEGTFFFEGDTTLLGTTNYPALLEFSDGTTNNRIALYIADAINDQLFAEITVAGISIASAVTTNNVSINTKFRGAVSWKAGVGGILLCLNGGTVAVSNLGSVPTGMVRFQIGQSVSTFNPFVGHAAHSGYYPKALDAATLGQITSINRGVDVVDAESIVAKFADLQNFVISRDPGFDPGVEYLTG